MKVWAKRLLTKLRNLEIDRNVLGMNFWANFRFGTPNPQVLQKLSIEFATDLENVTKALKKDIIDDKILINNLQVSYADNVRMTLDEWILKYKYPDLEDIQKVIKNDPLKQGNKQILWTIKVNGKTEVNKANLIIQPDNSYQVDFDLNTLGVGGLGSRMFDETFQKFESRISVIYTSWGKGSQYPNGMSKGYKDFWDYVDAPANAGRDLNVLKIEAVKRSNLYINADRWKFINFHGEIFVDDAGIVFNLKK